MIYKTILEQNLDNVKFLDIELSITDISYLNQLIKSNKMPNLEVLQISIIKEPNTDIKIEACEVVDI